MALPLLFSINCSLTRGILFRYVNISRVARVTITSKRSWEEDPSLPKPPNQPYTCFMKQFLLENKPNFPSMGQKELFSMASQQWKSISPEEKSVLYSKYEEEVAEYKKSMKSVEGKENVEEQQAVIPKRPLAPYLRFIKHFHIENKPKFPTLLPKDLIVMAAQEWKALDPQEKEKMYSDYKLEMEEYKLLPCVKSNLSKPLKRPKTPFMRFKRHYIRSNNTKEPKQKITELNSSASQLWKGFNQQEKNKWAANYQQEMKEYKINKTSSVRELASKASVAKQLGLPRPPSQPPKPYSLYLRNFLQENKPKFPNLTHKEMFCNASYCWSTLSPQEKEKWSSFYEQEMEEYKLKFNEYLENLTADEVESLKQLGTKYVEYMAVKKEKQEVENLGKPKRADNSFMCFIKSMDRGKTSFKIFLSSASKMWKELPAEKKTFYQDEAKKLQAQYVEDMAAWEEKMIRIGKSDLVRKTVARSKYKNTAAHKNKDQDSASGEEER